VVTLVAPTLFAAASLTSVEVFRVFIEASGAVGAPAALFSGMLAYLSFARGDPMDKVGEAATCGLAASCPLGLYLASRRSTARGLM
jgi:hypothetical protein